MKKLLILLSVSVFISILSYSADNNLSTLNKNPSAIKWEDTCIDLGEIQEKTDAMARFKFTNSGEKAIVVKDVRTSDLINPEYTRDTVKQGNNGFIYLYVSTLVPGRYNEYCSVELNNGKRVTLHVQWSVFKECVKWDTSSITINKIPRDSMVTVVFTFANYTKEPIIVRDVRMSDPMLPTYQRIAVLPGKSGQVSIQLWTGDLGTHNKSCYITLSNGETKVLFVHWDVVEGKQLPK